MAEKCLQTETISSQPTALAAYGRCDVRVYDIHSEGYEFAYDLGIANDMEVVRAKVQARSSGGTLGHPLHPSTAFPKTPD